MCLHENTEYSSFTSRVHTRCIKMSRKSRKNTAGKFIHVVNLWPEEKGSNCPRRSSQELPAKLRVSSRSCWNREDWFVVVLKQVELEVRLLVEPPSCNNGVMGLWQSSRDVSEALLLLFFDYSQYKCVILAHYLLHRAFFKGHISSNVKLLPPRSP